MGNLKYFFDNTNDVKKIFFLQNKHSTNKYFFPFYYYKLPYTVYSQLVWDIQNCLPIKLWNYVEHCPTLSTSMRRYINAIHMPDHIIVRMPSTHIGGPVCLSRSSLLFSLHKPIKCFAFILCSALRRFPAITDTSSRTHTELDSQRLPTCIPASDCKRTRHLLAK